MPLLSVRGADGHRRLKGVQESLRGYNKNLGDYVGALVCSSEEWGGLGGGIKSLTSSYHKEAQAKGHVF